MATKEQQRIFHEAVLSAYRQHGFVSYRQAEQVTGIKYATVHSIVSREFIPERGTVIEWAEGLHEPVNEWLELAGYDPIPPELVSGAVPAGMKIITVGELRFCIPENEDISPQTADEIAALIKFGVAAVTEGKRA